MKTRTLLDLTLEGFKNIYKNRLVSTFAIFTVFVSLSIVNIFTFMLHTISNNVDNLQNDVKIVAFIDDQTSDKKIEELNKEIKENDKVTDVTYVSKEDGLKEYKEIFKTDDEEGMGQILEEVTKEGNNPIPASFQITPTDPKDMEVVKDELLAIDGIYKVDDAATITNFLQGTKSMTEKIGIAFIVGMIVISVTLIAYTIKVAVSMRKNEIGILKYIGATDRYVRLPFLIEGLIIGLIGALLSLVVIVVAYNNIIPNVINDLNSYITGFVVPSLSSLLTYMIPLTLAVGALTGIIGSYISMRKYLKV